MDVFPSLMEYLRIPVKDEWDLDGKSRLNWAEPVTESEKCEQTKTKAIITLSGGYLFDYDDPEDLVIDECLSSTSNNGQFHYTSWSHCIGAKYSLQHLKTWLLSGLLLYLSTLFDTNYRNNRVLFLSFKG